MDLSNLRSAKGATKKRKRVGRGPGSTLGKTCGKGQKGQKARAGGGIRPGFEGGQMPLQRRLPKRGFTNNFRTQVASLNVRDLEIAFADGEEVTMVALAERGMIPARVETGDDGTKSARLKVDAVKILGDGELTKGLRVSAHRFSKSAIAKIEAAGGSVTRL